MGRVGDLLIKVAFFAYVIVAFFVGLSKGGNGGAVWTIIDGAFWPVTLLVAWIRQGYVPL